jgi:hypothetical protein
MFIPPSLTERYSFLLNSKLIIKMSTVGFRIDATPFKASAPKPKLGRIPDAIDVRDYKFLALQPTASIPKFSLRPRMPPLHDR